MTTKHTLRVTATIAGAMALASLATPAHSDAAEEQHWYRCNTHTHTKAFPESDANATPDVVARWYKEHGYQCLVITDHEHLTEVRPLNESYGKDGTFLVIPGQEITQYVADPTQPNGVRHLHVNGINTSRVVMPRGSAAGAPVGTSSAELFKRNLSGINDAGGLAQINHPNMQWSVHLGDLTSLDGPFLLEIWNAAATSNNLGGKDEQGRVYPSTEDLWDGLLSHGKVVWGIGSDDAHQYAQFDNPEALSPGKAWIVIRARSLTLPAVMEALRQGRFYASTGIFLADYRVDDRAVVISIPEPIGRGASGRPGPKRQTRYLTRFIGADGRVLAELAGLSPRYEFKGNEQYVRASITDSDGRRAWTQPVFLDERKAHR